jgi:hypothetical protein
VARLPKLVVDLGEPGSDIIKIGVSWWTRPRDHQMLTTYDRVLTAIRKPLWNPRHRKRWASGRALPNCGLRKGMRQPFRVYSFRVMTAAHNLYG